MFEPANPEHAPFAVQTVTVTCTLDSRAHAVHDIQLAAALETGRYNALCGHIVTAAPLAEPDGLPCLLCEALVDRPVGPRRHRSLRRQR
ncbi:MAG TPA: hypothetical protein VGE11_13015 [Pseudonocardia sp.]